MMYFSYISNTLRIIDLKRRKGIDVFFLLLSKVHLSYFLKQRDDQSPNGKRKLCENGVRLVHM